MKVLPKNGSSPLTRGKLSCDGLIVKRDGLIPAHAGKISQGAAQIHAHDGSSPLTRGKCATPGQLGTGIGLIPAHAGKIWPWPPARPPCGAHPRSRGENLNQPLRAETTRGSSPLTRGKWEADVARWLESGLIPAHAGKMGFRLGAARLARAHPRSRGENPGGVPV